MPKAPRKYRSNNPASVAPSLGGKPKIWKKKDRLSPSVRGYDRAWARFRKGYLARNPLCRTCILPTGATEIDHIRPLLEGGDKFDESNLQPLCKSCHSKKTIQDQKRRRKNAKSEGSTRNH